MAEFTFEGNQQSLTPRQLELISKVLQERGLKYNKVDIGKLGKPGDNYAADVQKITAILDDGNTFSMVAKVGPTHEMARATMATELIFKNESIMYTEILPKLANLQQAAGLSQNEIFRFAKCYGTLMEPMNEIILLEDLKELNFEMLDRFTPLTDETVKQILKTYAVFHSLSFVMKKRDPDEFDSLNNKFIDLYGALGTNAEIKQSMAGLEENVLGVLDNEKYKKAVRGSVSQMFEQTLKIQKSDSNSRYSVVIHGDAWTNNFMFRLEDNIPVEAIIIDYQAARLGNPVHDLLYMLFSCTDYASRHRYYYEWIDYYHAEFDKSLNNYGLKANYLYPRDQLDADLRRYAKVYFATAIMIATVLLRKTDDAAKLMESFENSTGDITTILNLAGSTDSNYIAMFKAKVEDLVDSYRDFGYIE